MSAYKEIGSLKTGSYILIDGNVCEVVSIEKSKPGKHGAAKAKITAIGVFDGTKRTLIGPVNKKVEVPIVEKRRGQVISIQPEIIQIMDLETYEVLEAPKPDEELLKKLKSGVEIEYWTSMGKVKITRLA